ncbi:homeobox protein Wariai-like [Homalodisca vitripennis]|uniref:homeobox protein Wariai-like n=1 Tax=Homalodisca vitripennis TaxID=197043 RepID=UPI001EEC5C1F|nr:homeobox protein Wariai-like [Homalodisca vitripennis]
MRHRFVSSYIIFVICFDKNKMTVNIGNRDLIDQIRSILEGGGDINTTKDRVGNNLLHCSIIEGNESAVQALLEMGVNLSIRNGEYKTPLNLAIQGDVGSGIIDQLMGKGARLDASDIFVVISHEKLHLLEKLLDKGLDVNYLTERDDKSLLHVAVQKNCFPAVEMLLMRGADVNIRTKTGHCPLHLVRTPEILELLLSREPDLNSKTRFGHSALHRMISNNFRVGVEMLLRRGAEPNVKDWSGATPLHFAVQDKNADLVKSLLDGGADMEIIDLRNKTPLNLALLSRFKGGVCSFLDKRLEILKYNKNYDPAVLASLDVEGELEACEAKLNRLSASIDEYEGEYTDTEGQRLQARLWHNYLRIQRIPVVTEADEGRQRKLLSEAKRLCDAASERRGAVEMGSEDGKEIVVSEPITNKTQPLRATAPVAANQANVGDSTPSPADQRTQPVSSSAIPPAPHDSYHRTRAVPVYKWGLMFDGRSQSVGAFLQRVEELRRARGVTPTELFESAVDLFSGPALVGIDPQ